MRGPLAARVAALDPCLGVAREGAETILFQRVREAFDVGDADLGRGLGALLAIEPVDYIVARYPRGASDGDIEDDARRIVWTNRRGALLADMEAHNDRVEAAARADYRRELDGAFRYRAGALRGTRYFGMRA